MRLAVFIGLLGLVGCGAPDRRHALILMDCSASLSAAERQSSLRIAEGLLRHGVREGDTYTVAGLDGELAAEPFASGTRRTRSESEAREYEEQVRAGLVRIRQEMETWSADRRRRERTCIVDSLLAAPRHFEKHGGLRGGAVFVISDMGEDCTHEGTRRDLCGASRQDMSAALQLGNSRPLSGLEITAILPYRTSANRKCEQSMEGLAGFWNEVAARIGTPVRLYYPSDRPDLFAAADD